MVLTTPMNGSPFVPRFRQYLRERFSPGQFVLLAVLCVGVVIRWPNALTHPNALNWWRPVFAGVGFLLFLFRLRVFDEYKDAAHDRAYHAERPVARGLISLAELSRLLWVTVPLEAAIAWQAGRVALVWWTIAFTYSLLLWVEFFVPVWLRRHFTSYIVWHEILLAPLFLSLMATSGVLTTIAPTAGQAMALLFLSSQLFLLEVRRKIYAPQDESPARDTYTSHYGLLGTMAMVVVLMMLMVGSSWWNSGRSTLWLGLAFVWATPFLVVLPHVLQERSTKIIRQCISVILVFVVLMDLSSIVWR